LRISDVHPGDRLIGARHERRIRHKRNQAAVAADARHAAPSGRRARTIVDDTDPADDAAAHIEQIHIFFREIRGHRTKGDEPAVGADVGFAAVAQHFRLAAKSVAKQHFVDYAVCDPTAIGADAGMLAVGLRHTALETWAFERHPAVGAIQHVHISLMIRIARHQLHGRCERDVTAVAANSCGWRINGCTTDIGLRNCVEGNRLGKG
jgi:hypothetical protein